MAPVEAKAALDAAMTLGEALNLEEPAKPCEQLAQLLLRIEVGERSITITIGVGSMRMALGIQHDGKGRDQHKIVVPARVTKRGVEQKLIVGADFVAPHIPDEALLTAIARADVWVQEITTGRIPDVNAIAKRENVPASYVRSHLPLEFLAPSIVTTVVEGRQPADLTLKHLMYRTQLPIDWPLQRRQLGFDR